MSGRNPMVAKKQSGCDRGSASASQNKIRLQGSERRSVARKKLNELISLHLCPGDRVHRASLTLDEG